MTTIVNEKIFTVVAGQDLRPADMRYKAITFDGTIAAVARAAAGLLTTSVNSGGHASAVYDGVTKGRAAAAVASKGWPATITTSGFVTNAASGNDTIGRFVETCNSGDVVRLMLDISVLGYQAS